MPPATFRNWSPPSRARPFRPRAASATLPSSPIHSASRAVRRRRRSVASPRWHRQMERTVGVAALRSFIELAKMDHLLFKLDVYQVFMGTTTRNAGDLATHTDCRLGKWYYEGEGKHLLLATRWLPDAGNPHVDVHRHGRMAVERVRAGDIAAGVDAVEQMEAASMACCRASSEWPRMALPARYSFRGTLTPPPAVFHVCTQYTHRCPPHRRRRPDRRRQDQSCAPPRAHLDAQLLLEQPELNPFLSRFYQDQQRLCPADAVVLPVVSGSTSYASCRSRFLRPPGGRRLSARKGSAVRAADAQ
jgi:hypothetical protein